MARSASTGRLGPPFQNDIRSTNGDRTWHYLLVMQAHAPILNRDGLAERERVLSILREQEPALRAQGITRLRLFGSMARGEAGPDSDV